jgi:hypothetical protein
MSVPSISKLVPKIGDSPLLKKPEPRHPIRACFREQATPAEGRIRLMTNWPQVKLGGPLSRQGLGPSFAQIWLPPDLQDAAVQNVLQQGVTRARRLSLDQPPLERAVAELSIRLLLLRSFLFP